MQLRTTTIKTLYVGVQQSICTTMDFLADMLTHTTNNCEKSTPDKNDSFVNTCFILYLNDLYIVSYTYY